ncbi:hypothetical protein HDU97_007518 [Phlyctochytrium planicorne]|nr:hypothetical protein HDU97_007518 [Phlyctochytrium planicorne]
MLFDRLQAYSNDDQAELQTIVGAGILLLTHCLSIVDAAPQPAVTVKASAKYGNAPPKRIQINPVADPKILPSKSNTKPKIAPNRIASSASAVSQPSQKPKTEEKAVPASPVAQNAASTLDLSALPKLFLPRSQFEIVPLKKSVGRNSKIGDAETAAKQYVTSKTKGEMSNLKVVSNVKSDHGVRHIHLIETFNNIPIVNLVHNVNLDRQSNIISAGISNADLSKLSLVGDAAKSLSAVEAIEKVLSALGITGARSALRLSDDKTKVTGAPFDDGQVKVSSKMYYLPDGRLDSAWELEAQIDMFQRYIIWVSSTDGSILGANTLVFGLNGSAPKGLSASSDQPRNNSISPGSETLSRRGGRGASFDGYVPQLVYRAVPLEKDSFGDGGSILMPGYPIPEASPKGWHNFITNDGRYDTQGNNVQALDWIDQKSTFWFGGNFDFKYQPSDSPEQTIDAARTNLFYISNKVHDIFYKYGFTERFRNCQFDNFGKGGIGNDGVKAYGLWTDAAQKDNGPTFLAFEVDGTSPSLFFSKQYINGIKPFRDPAMDNNVLIASISVLSVFRIISPTGSCVSTSELDTYSATTGGLARIMASWFTLKKTDSRSKDNVYGTWVSNNPTGVDKIIVSTNLNTNGMKWSDVKPQTGDVGQLVALVLYEVYWNMVEQAGFESDLTLSNSGKGNTAFMRILFDALKLMPCPFKLFDVRDSMLQADALRYNADFQCAIWRGFAKRGAGVNAAANAATDNFDVPASCKTA